MWEPRWTSARSNSVSPSASEDEKERQEEEKLERELADHLKQEAAFQQQQRQVLGRE